MRPLPERCRLNVISLVKQGISTREIEKKLGISHSTVNRISQKFCKGEKFLKSGRRPLLTAKTKHFMVHLITTGKVENAVTLTQCIKECENISVSPNTTRRALKEAWLRAFEKTNKPKLSKRHIKQRLDFAFKHRDWQLMIGRKSSGQMKLKYADMARMAEYGVGKRTAAH